MPKGFMATQKGMRNINWRNDKPATIYYVEALDEGDPAIETEFRDEVFLWEAPFTETEINYENHSALCRNFVGQR
jgi:hypothetical protein